VTIFSALRDPLLWSDEFVIENVLGIDEKKSSISLIGNTATIVTVGNQFFEGCPVDIIFSLEGRVNRLIIFKLTHVVSQQVLTDQVIGVIESIDLVPTERFELLSLNQDGVEPAETIDGLSELS
jgi:hypothetical protein